MINFGLGWFEMEGLQYMNTAITGRHMEMTDALRAYIENGLRKLESHFDKVLDADVVLTVEKHRHIAEIVTQVPHHGQIESKVEKNDMYAAIDEAVEHTARQLRKWADRVHEHKGREGLGRVDKVIHRAQKG